MRYTKYNQDMALRAEEVPFSLHPAEVLTDLQLQMKVAHLAHLALHAPRDERQAAALAHIEWKAELDKREIVPPDITNLMKLMAAVHKGRSFGHIVRDK